MEIRLAKTAGFCFGVNRAVELTYNLLNEGHKVATLGPLIHNPQAVADMERRGALVADTVDDIPTGYEVIIRSHGVPRTIYDTLEQRGLVYHDATCPFVKKIQSIAARAEAEGAVLLVAGDAAHPEVQGIVGHTRGEVFVFSDLDELKAWKGPSDPQKPIFAVAQTTFQVTKWQESSEFLKKAYTNARIFDTICNATWARQQEAEDLSQQCDIIVVIGGHHSSNTQKLVQVAAKHTKAVTVETASELRPEWFADVKTAGVTAGASTPSSIIEEVLNSMSAEINDSMSFEEMLNASEEKRVHAGSIVKGIVTSISANEIQVDIGAKQTGFVKLSELTDDSSAKVEDLVKVGDELDLIVEKVMDQDGVIQLSRKKLASRKGMEEIAKLLNPARSSRAMSPSSTRAALSSTSRVLRCSFPVLRPRCAVTRTTLLWLASMSSWSLPSAPAARSSAASTRSPLSRTRQSVRSSGQMSRWARPTPALSRA